MNLHELLGIVGSLSEAHRPIRLRLSHAQRVLDDVLLVQHVNGTETLCGGLSYRLLCVSTQAGLPLREFIGLPAELQFVTDRGGLRSVCGIVERAAEGQGDGGLATYQLVLRDALAIMEQRTNTRVFLGANELDITRVLIDEWRAGNPVLARAFALDVLAAGTHHPAREFIMQSNESDAAFLRRLWKQRGIAWFIRPGHSSATGSSDTPAHTLVLVDRTAQLARNGAGTVRCHRGASTEQRDVITGWSAMQTLKPGLLSRQSWDYKTARMASEQFPSKLDQGSQGQYVAASLEDHVIDVPHAGDDADDYRYLGNLRMLRHEYEAMCFHGESDIRDLCVGEWNQVAGHPQLDSGTPSEREFVITELHVDARNNLPKELDERILRLFAACRWDVSALAAPDAAHNGMRYSNRFSCVRRDVQLVPAFDPRADFPPVHPMTALVVCASGREVDYSELGCVRIRIPGCRMEDHTHARGAGASGTGDDSAWVRVASPWAGAHFGFRASFRAGNEVLLSFLGGDPSRPIIVGAVHGGRTPPAVFSQVGTLPGNQFLSGMVSREVGGTRANQLRLDDTPGQISAQLASDHGASQLNLGYLTHPRHEGVGEVRGEGAELRSDKTVSLRGGQGVYLSADARLRATGRMLDRDGLAGLADALKGIQQELSGLAAAHRADAADGKALEKLAEHVAQWENGSNTAAGPSAVEGGQPIVAIDGPAGVMVGSGAGITLGAQSHVDLVSVGNTQVSAGRKLLMRASEGLSLFAHKVGVKLIAASGKVDIQAHQDDIELTSAKRIVLSSSDEIVLQAPKVSIITQGAQTAIGGGAITHQLSGAYTVKSASFAHQKPGDANPAAVKLPKSMAEHDQRVRITDLNTGRPMPNQRYRATLEDGQVVEGTTDAEGLTQVLKSSIPFARYKIEALDD